MQEKKSKVYNLPMCSSSLPDPYMPSYYASAPYSFVNQGIGEAAWSNSSEPMTYLSSYGGQMGSSNQSHYMDGMFGQNSFGGYGQNFGYFPNGGGESSTWGSATLAPAPSRKSEHASYQDAYCRDVYGVDHGAALKHMEQGMGGLCIAEQKTTTGGPESAVPPPPAKEVAHDPLHKYAKRFDAPADGFGGPLRQPVGSKKSWATVAGQPAKPQAKVKPKPIPPQPPSDPGKPRALGVDIGTWDGGAADAKGGVHSPPSSQQPGAKGGGFKNGGGTSPQKQQQLMGGQNSGVGENYPQHPVLDKLRMENNYNPKEFDLNPKNARFFIIKSYSEDDIHRSIKYSIWCSTEHGNRRLDQAFRESKGPVYLFYSVNGSGHFCGMAEMVSCVDHDSSAGVWAQSKWKGQFKVKWIYVKDVPNSQLRYIRLENNENKPVTNSRDTQEMPPEKGKQMMKIMHNFCHTTSIFDDFLHYEKRQEEDEQRKIQI